jgi:interferon-induced GTP-binding protein Mx1
VSVQWKNPPKDKSEQELSFPTKFIDEESWDQLPESISLAQEHIIKITGKEVASDIVQVQIAGPECENLTLVDLPGIVRTTGKGESETLGADIKDLIDVYLKNKRCVILAVIPANVDFHNSQIMQDAQQVDPKTERTIPVITKPDLIDTGAEPDVLDLLLGKKTTEFQYGFHMVKNRGQEALNNKATLEFGLESEARYFQNTAPWKDIRDRDLMGTPELRSKLGQLQLDLIRSSLPQITKEMEAKRAAALSELSVMGVHLKTLAEKRGFFFEVKDELKRRIETDSKGSDNSSWINDPDHIISSAIFHGKCSEFGNNLKNGQLAHISAVPKGSKVIVTLQAAREVKGVVVGEQEGGLFIDYETRGTENITELVESYQHSISSTELQEKGGNSWLAPTGNLAIATDGQDKYDVLRPIPRKQVRRDPEWLLDLIQRNRPDELPIFPNPAVFNAIVASFIENDWAQPCEALVQTMHDLLKDLVNKAFDSSNKASRYGSLRQFLMSRITQVLHSCTELAKEEVAKFIDRELKPYTQDHYLFENLAKKSNEWLRTQLMVALGLPCTNRNVHTDTVQSIVEAVFDKNQKKSMDTHMAEQMEHALDSYGKVALKRFIDLIPQICWSTIRRFPQELEHDFRQISDEDLTKRMVDNASFTRKYEELEKEAQALKEGLDILREALL